MTNNGLFIFLIFLSLSYLSLSKNLIGKKGYLLALDHAGPDLIDFYPVDAFVNTACPRIAIDDAVKYAKPLITPFELEVSLGEKSWEHGYQFDEIP